MSILTEIAGKTEERVKLEMAKCSLADMKNLARNTDTGKADFLFKEALRRDKINFICEVKKASPSKGIIAEDFPYLDIAKEYEKAGAAAISCLTEPFYFKGADEYLSEISKAVSIPVLRKDFTVHEYMIYQAKTLGASAVLLIVSILSKEQIKEYLDIAHSLGLSALVEAHDEDEVNIALECGAGIIGVNNRNLADFTVDINNSVRLRTMVPSEIVFVSESGMKTKEDIMVLSENGTNAVLIGETLMRAADKKAKLDELKSLI